MATAGKNAVPKRMYGKRQWTCHDTVSTYMQIYSLLIYENFTTTPPGIDNYFEWMNDVFINVW